MSGGNPYAVNGNNTNNTNPYGTSPANNPYGGAGRFANDPYIQQNSASTASVNSYGSRGERRRAPDQVSLTQRRPSPGPQGFSHNGTQRSVSPSTVTNTDSRPGRTPRAGGGYGGLGPPQGGGYEQETQQTPPSRPRTSGRDRPGDRERDTERDGDNNRNRAHSDGRTRERRNAPDPREMPPPPMIPAASATMRQYSPRRPVKSMDEILKHIKTGWRSMEGDECVPVKVALQLMDTSSIGLGDKEADFANTHVDLQKSLKQVVNEHYADFNSAVGTYHKIQASIRESQSRVRYLKNGLIAVRGGMLTTRPELRGLAEQSGELDGILSVLVQMEALREMPGRLEERISEKRWIGAVELLGEALRGCRRGELDEIGAMSDLRSYFASQETSLLDVLVEELHDHLYLKSPYCYDRWKGQKADGGEKDAKETFGGNTWDRPVYQFLSLLDTKKPMVEDASKNPETETFRYIHMVVEALHKLGYLEETVARIEQRMPVELYKVVDKTNNEIDAKYPLHLRKQSGTDQKAFRMLQFNDSGSQVLSDFLWTLYAKFEAIAEGHRVLHEVVMGIAEREKISRPERYTTGFKELWKLYQMEIRSLLHDYLAADNDLTLGKSKAAATNIDIFSKRSRDKNRKMFKLSELDSKASDLKAEEADLDQILKSSVPGLVSKSRAQLGTNSTSERNDQDGTAAGHKLLIEPSVFNMTVLLPPSLTFLQHLKDIVPQTSQIPMSTLTSFLDDFLINVFHPQLEEAVTELCTQCFMDIEAFTEDSQWSKHSPHPIFKGTMSFMALIRAFSNMLSSIPQDQMFTQLVISQLMAYYDKCFSFYKAMVSRGTVSPSNSNSNTNTVTWKAAAGLAESGDIHDTAIELLKSDIDRSAHDEMTNKIVQLLLTTTKNSPVSAYDIISDPKSVHQLSLLYNSMQWLSSSLSQLRHVESSSGSNKTHSRNASQINHTNQRRWTLITSLKTSTSAISHGISISPIYLPLNSETVVPFDTTLSSYQALAQRSLMTLHLDIRIGIIHQLGRALRPITPENTNGQQSSTTTTDQNRTSSAPIDSGLYPFVLLSPPTSASPRILDLNNDLISIDASLSTHLGLRERQYILSGLDRLVDRYLVVGADYIQVMNSEGAERMRVDTMVIQQVLRGLCVETLSAARGRKRTLLIDNAGDVNASIPSIPTSSTTQPQAQGLGISSTATPTLPIHSPTTQPSSSTPDPAFPPDPLLTSASTYYTLYLQGPDQIITYISDCKSADPPRDVGYTYDELRTLIELCFSATLRGENREEALRARKRLNDLLLRLGELLWDS